MDLEKLNYKELRQVGLIKLPWDLKSKTCKGISDQEFNCAFAFVFCVIFNQECCIFIQYNLRKVCC